jgi:photosystem II stability/assembly factor-like uncharacterized protein
LAAIIFGISELPVAPVAPDATPIPNTAVGRLLEQIEMINFQSSQVGWAVLPTSPYWRVLRTTDAGARFQDVNPPGNASNGGLALTVMGPNTAAVVFLAYQYIRDSTFAFTSDGGADWTAGILPNAASTGPDPIYVLSAHRIFAVLGNDSVVGTSDGGQTWSTITLPSMPSGSCSPTSVWFTSPTSGWITGHCSGVAGLWHSTDAGQSWQAVVLSGSYAPSAAITVAPPDLTPSGGALVSVTATSGSHQSLRVFNDSSGPWIAAPALALPAGRLLVSFANSTNGWVLVAPRGDASLALEYYTSNDGIDWSLRTTPIAADQVTAFDLVTPSHAVVLAGAGRTSNLWSSTDGGANWSSSKVSIFSGPIPRVNGITG